ncbi:MAG: hypothetical protein ACJ8AW_37450 [Rhodopila sp.]
MTPGEEQHARQRIAAPGFSARQRHHGHRTVDRWIDDLRSQPCLGGGDHARPAHRADPAGHDARPVPAPAARRAVLCRRGRRTRQAGRRRRRRETALRGIEKTAFFTTVRTQTIGNLYGNPAVYRMFGYGGPSAPLGGYIDRGFDDIDWLPST